MKKIVMLLCVLFVLLPTQALAHSKLTESIPAKNETVTVSPEQIELTFNTSISPVSKFTVTNENGEEQTVENISVNDRQLSGTINSPLANGQYTVAWDVIGADGHAVKGEISFTVDAPESTQPAEPIETEAGESDGSQTENSNEENTDSEQLSTSEPTAEPTVEPTASPATEQAEPASEDGSNVWLYVVIAIVLIAVVVVLVRRK